MFVEENPNDRIRSTVRRHPLEGSGHDTASRVAREAIQNSVDATLPDQKTEVLIRNMTLSPAEAAAFRELLGFDAQDSPLARLDELGLAFPNALTRLRDGETCTVTIVEDRNTCGLGWDERDQKDRFEELCLSLGQDKTSVTTGRGGSYGLGKAVYEEASNCNMFVVYSVFEPSENTNGHHARLFVCATFDGHEWSDAKYTGRALFGVHKMRSSGQSWGQPECRPIVDDMAHEIAEKIGFTRMSDELGTSIMIVGSSIDIADFRAAVERWWWPRVLSNKLTVELWVNNEAVGAPTPRAVEALEAHVTCYTMIEHSVDPGPGEKKQRFRRYKGRHPGHIALKALDDPHPGAATDSSDDLLENSVALIRSGPLMVVEYLKIPSPGDRKCVGVFLSHDDADEALHLSEPPAHNTWDAKSYRLQDAYPDDPEEREVLQGLVLSIMRRIKATAKKFIDDLNPKREPPPVKGSRRLEQILSKVMAGRRKIPPPPPPPSRPDPFEIRIEEGRENSDVESFVTARVKITLKEDASAESVVASCRIVPTVVLDDNRRRDGSGRVSLASLRVDEEDVDPVANNHGVNVLVRKDRESVVEVVSEPFNRDYYASLDVIVTGRPEKAGTDESADASDYDQRTEPSN